MCVLEGFLWGEVGVVVWGRVVRFRVASLLMNFSLLDFYK